MIPSDAKAGVSQSSQALQSLSFWYLCSVALHSWQVSARPNVKVWRALELKAEPEHENLATKNQAMNVWSEGASDPSRELVVALIHQWHDMDRRADDQQWGVVWESDGKELREVQRVPMSCPDVELVVPNRGPYVYEARLDLTPGSLHPECSCQPVLGRPCPHGVHAIGAGGSDAWNLSSPVESHFVTLTNEWNELIADRAVLGRLDKDVEAEIVLVATPLLNATVAAANTDVSQACPGTADDIYGGGDVTLEQLERMNMRLPSGHVSGKWCFVKRGGCSETAKAKVCELSGAVGVLIMDHGSFAGDQDITIRYSRAANERSRSLPVLFISKLEGENLLAAMAGQFGADVKVKVGPSVGGPAPATYSTGSGIVVHALGGKAPSSGPTRKPYPDIFATAGWVEVSAVRDLLFVCLPDEAKVKIYNVSQPLVDIPFLGYIEGRCSRYGLHDYRVLDYRGPDGRYHTLLVDPSDAGNRLYYYDTDDVSNPRLELELHANWEAESDGLGQVRPGGPDGRYHIVTWHCSDVYCGKNHGDSMYVLDTWNLTQLAMQVKLPMLSKGGFARDVACGADGVCLVSLTWDGLAAVDSGVEGTANMFKVIADYTGASPFSNSHIPSSYASLRVYSGAQKSYASKQYSRHFYVEHADFSLRPLRMGDAIRALQLREIYFAQVDGYDAAVQVSGAAATAVASSVIRSGEDDDILSSEPLISEGAERRRPERDTVPVSLFVALLGVMLLALVLISVLLLLAVAAWRANKRQKEALERSHHEQQDAEVGGSRNVVVGRPVGAADDGTAATGDDVAKPAAGEALGKMDVTVVQVGAKGDASSKEVL